MATAVPPKGLGTTIFAVGIVRRDSLRKDRLS